MAVRSIRTPLELLFQTLYNGPYQRFDYTIYVGEQGQAPWRISNDVITGVGGRQDQITACRVR